VPIEVQNVFLLLQRGEKTKLCSDQRATGDKPPPYDAVYKMIALLRQVSTKISLNVANSTSQDSVCTVFCFGGQSGIQFIVLGSSVAVGEGSFPCGKRFLEVIRAMESIFWMMNISPSCGPRKQPVKQLFLHFGRGSGL
jgi:hypothetical protein